VDNFRRFDAVDIKLAVEEDKTVGSFSANRRLNPCLARSV
jgi:hypothetical protein